MSITTYPAFFHQEDGDYIVRIPDFPCLITFGIDYNDAYQMAIDAIASSIDLCRQEGEGIPQPSAPESLEPEDGEFLVMVSADIEAYLNACYKKAHKRVKKIVRLPRWQIEEAKDWGIDLSVFLEKKLEKEIDRLYEAQKQHALELANSQD